MNLYPFNFKPIYKEKIWGGNSLHEFFNRNLPNNSIGESWEVAAHPHGTSIIQEGIYQGKTLTELIEKKPEEMLGTKFDYDKDKRFPLLVKILDANAKLSVQVHPSDYYAKDVENDPGKTEMWYILDAKPGAKLVYGLKPGTSKEEFSKAIKNDEIKNYLNEVEVERGDVYFIPAGTIHAIEEGILLAEIQQNSDTTYRVYDWDRVGKDGSPRELHIEKALDVINFNFDIKKARSKPLTLEGANHKRSFLAACPFFISEKIELNGIYNLRPDGQSFYILMNSKGIATIKANNKAFRLGPGQTYFIPAALDDVIIDGEVEFLLSYLPKSKENTIKNLKHLNFSEEEINNLPGISNWNNNLFLDK